MQRKDFMRLSGADQGSVEYLPIALLLRTGYGCAGYYNTSMNHALEDLIVLLNCRLIDLRNRDGSGPVITDFNDFLQKVVFEHYKVGEGTVPEGHAAHATNTIPLAAISLSDVAVFYPVEQISRLMRLIQKNRNIGKLIQVGDQAAEQPVVTPVAANVATPGTPDVAPVVPITPIGAAAAVAVPAPDAPTPETPQSGTAPADGPTDTTAAAPTDAEPAPLSVLAEAAATAQTTNVASQTTGASANSADEDAVPTFLDFNHKSVVLAVLRTKLW